MEPQLGQLKSHCPLEKSNLEVTSQTHTQQGRPMLKIACTPSQLGNKLDCV